MKRLAIVAFALALAAHPGTQAAARSPLLGPPAHYYGPLRNWHGVGYKQELQKDGSWRVLAESRPMDGENFARNAVLHRAAELAREQGHAWVQVLGGTVTRGTGLANRGQESATIFVRPADTADQPAKCLRKTPKPGNCYTANVAEILTMVAPLLGLATPARPGFAMAPPPRLVAPPFVPVPVPAAHALPPVPRVATVAPPGAAAAPQRAFEQRLKAAAPAVGRQADGTTISD